MVVPGASHDCCRGLDCAFGTVRATNSVRVFFSVIIALRLFDLPLRHRMLKPSPLFLLGMRFVGSAGYFGTEARPHRLVERI